MKKRTTKKRSYKRTAKPQTTNPIQLEPYGSEFSHLQLIPDLELAAQYVYYSREAVKYSRIQEAYEREISYRERIKANS